MERLPSELEFISRILPDGTGVELVDNDDVPESKYRQMKLTSLSVSNQTYLAHGFSTWVVKLKNRPPKEKRIKT